MCHIVPHLLQSHVRTTQGMANIPPSRWQVKTGLMAFSPSGGTVDRALDKIIGFHTGHEAQETNNYGGDIQIQDLPASPKRTASSVNTLLGHLHPCG